MAKTFVEEFRIKESERLRKKRVSYSQRIQAVLDLGYRRVFGGSGSGNWGHEGRPGELGGSAPDCRGGGSPESQGDNEGVKVRDKLTSGLQKAEFTPEKTIAVKGANATRVIHIGKVKGFGKAVWKSLEGEHFKKVQGVIGQREQAVWEVDRLIGAQVSPPAVVKDFKGKPGFLTGFAGSADVSSLNPKDAAKIRPDDWKRVAVLDYVINNRDRHGGNIRLAQMPDGSYRLRAIDQGLSFGNEFNWQNAIAIRNVQSNVEKWGKDLPQGMEKKWSSLSKDTFTKRLSPLLKPQEIDGAWTRLQTVKQKGIKALWENPLPGYRPPKAPGRIGTKKTGARPILVKVVTSQ